jgi:hypothetical protein
MTELTIGRLATTVSVWPPGDTARVPAMVEGVASHRLDEALRAAPLPSGDWCIRRLDLEVTLDPGRPSGALEAAWAETIVSRLHGALRDPAIEVVHFARQEDALDDLLTGLVAGRTEHEWAWRQVGLVEPADPGPQQAPRDLLLMVLHRHPNGAPGAVVRLVRRAGVAAVHRLLGAEGWRAAAGAATRGRGDSILERLLALPTHADQRTDDPGTSHVDVTHAPGTRPSGPVPESQHLPTGPTERRPESTAVPRLVASLVSRSSLAAAVVASGIRVDDQTRRAWALLLLADLAPTELDRDTCADLVEAVAVLLRTERPNGLQTRTVPRPVAPAPEDVQARTGESSSAPSQSPVGAAAAASTAADSDDTTPPDDRRDGAATTWAGLVFLLNTAEELGLPDVVEQHASLGGRPLPWVLQHVGLRLVPATADDPAVLALAGIDPASPWHRELPPDDREIEALDELCLQWASCTADRLTGPDTTTDETPVDVVRRIARRPGTVLSEPGWTEVVLSQDDVDLDVRRAGLDLDPGWVWWLGSVVRFRYA